MTFYPSVDSQSSPSTERRHRAEPLRSIDDKRASRHVARRFALPIETALLVAECAGLGGSR